MSIDRVSRGALPGPHHPPRLNEIARQITPRVLARSDALVARSVSLCDAPTSVFCAKFSITWRSLDQRGVTLPNIDLTRIDLFDWGMLPAVARISPGVYAGHMQIDAPTTARLGYYGATTLGILVEVLSDDAHLLRLARDYRQHPSARQMKRDIPFTLLVYRPQGVAAA